MFGLCDTIVEAKEDPNTQLDKHWCQKDAGHSYMHACSCGFRWEDEAPC